MAINRIVSFLPSATELLYELGVDHMIFGVTHECNFPKDACKKPRIISSVFDPEKLSSLEIDKKTGELLKEGKDIFKLNEDILLEAKPDLIISQTTCEVCAAHNNQVEKALRVLPEKPIIHSMDPHSLEEIIQSISKLTDIIGYQEKGTTLQQQLKERIGKIKDKDKKSTPSILAIEWIQPFFTAGHWIPEMIHVAGGNNLISKSGEHSRKLSLQEIKDSDPDNIVIMPCGFDLERTQKEYQNILANNKEWNGLRAVRNGKVFLVNADSYFSKPSIRTVTGLEILAKVIQPHEFKSLEIPEGSFMPIK